MKSTSSNEYLDIDRIRANPAYAVYVTMPDGSQLKGLLDSGKDFNLSTGSTYSDTMSNPSFAAQLNGLAAVYANLNDAAQFVIKSTRLSEAAWQGCKNPSFDIGLEIPIAKKSDNPWEYIKYQLKCTMPTTSNGDVFGQLALNAPNGYRVNYGSGAAGDSPEGTVSLRIGNWFEAHRMVVTDAQSVLSGRKHYDGSPMSIMLNMSFQFWRQPTYEDALSWFILAGQSKTSKSSSKIRSTLTKAASTTRAAQNVANNKSNAAQTVARNSGKKLNL